MPSRILKEDLLLSNACQSEHRPCFEGYGARVWLLSSYLASAGLSQGARDLLAKIDARTERELSPLRAHPYFSIGGLLSPSVIYFCDLATPDAPLKIGRTGSLERRLNLIAKSVPYPVRLRGSIVASPLMERSIHRTLKPLQLRGEWYRSAEALIEIVAAIGHQVPSDPAFNQKPRFAIVSEVAP